MNTIDLSKQLIKMHKYESQEGKREAAEFIAGYLTENGLHVERISSNGIANIIGSTNGRKEKTKKMIFNGHYDTVPPSPAWVTNPFDPVVKNGELYGLGACDMTCNLAAMINAAIAVSKQNLNGEVVLVATGDEEIGSSNGTPVTIEKGVVADYALIGESTAMQLATGHKCRVEVGLTAEGKQAHGAYPAKGINAIHKMAKALAKLAETFKPKSLETEYLFNNVSMTTSLISGGVAPNVIPGKCTAVIDFRIPPKMSSGEFLEKLKRECGDVSVNINQVDIGWLEDENSQFVKTAHAALGEVTREGKPFMHKMGASDARFYAAVGIPTINVGAGDMKQHVPDEKMNLKQLEQVEKFYCEIAKKMVG